MGGGRKGGGGGGDRNKKNFSAAIAGGAAGRTGGGMGGSGKGGKGKGGKSKGKGKGKGGKAGSEARASVKRERKDPLAHLDGSTEKARTSSLDDVEGMTVDDFMDTGFDAMMEAVSEDDEKAEESFDEGDDDEEEEEEEEEEKDEDDAVGEENGRLTTEVGQMKKDMADLEKKDPEFYKFLQENKGEGLLDFDMSDDEGEFEEGEDSEEDEEEDDISGDENKGEEKEEEEEEEEEEEQEAVEGDDADDSEEEDEEEDTAAGTQLTSKMVDKWHKQIMEERSVRALRSMVMAFEAGAHVTDAVKKNDLRQSFDIASSGVFDQLMQLCISQMDSMLDKVVGINCCTADGLPSKDSVTKAKGWKRAESCAKRYLLAVTHFLHELSDDQMIQFVLFTS